MFDTPFLAPAAQGDHAQDDQRPRPQPAEGEQRQAGHAVSEEDVSDPQEPQECSAPNRTSQRFVAVDVRGTIGSGRLSTAT